MSITGATVSIWEGIPPSYIIKLKCPEFHSEFTVDSASIVGISTNTFGTLLISSSLDETESSIITGFTDSWLNCSEPFPSPLNTNPL